LSSDSWDSGSKKNKRGYGGAYDGSGGVCVWRESGVRRFCVGAVGVNLASVDVKMFHVYVTLYEIV
jgi:hypothetical protein